MISLSKLPQLCNYIVFYRSLQNNYLKQALQKMAKLNFYFAHLYYFYMKSLQKNITKEEIQVLKPVVEYNKWFRREMGEHYKEIGLTSLDLFIQNADVKLVNESDELTKNMIVDYESSKVEYGKQSKTNKVKTEDITLKKYASIFEGEPDLTTSFQSTLLLFEDLFYISKEIVKVQNRQQRAVQLLKMINENLLSNAYIPLFKNCYRICNILKFVTGETKVFSTKERAPLCICVETYCPADILSSQEEERFWTNIQVPITLKMTTFTQRASYFARNFQRTAQFKKQRQSTLDVKKWGGSITNIMFEQRIKSQRLNEYIIAKPQVKEVIGVKGVRNEQRKQSAFVQAQLRKMNLGQKLIQNESFPYQKEKKTQQSAKSYNQNTKNMFDQQFRKFFGEPLKEARQRIAQNSIFGNLKSWDIMYIIIKTNDDLKQEQFAMQLIHQFDYIFKLEQLPLLLTTHQVLSMGPDRGIIELVRESVTFDRLQKTLQTAFPTKLTLKQFFEIYYEDNILQAKQNFMKSLAAYCLVMYIIQAKDRHNGNILLHRNGKIFHIDFGFFLSNMPGKGLQLQRDCPFKLLSQHIEVLDGVDSYYFNKFRQYFFHGFKAIRKHQNKVMMLVKLMYSTSGITMPCFDKGEAEITAMQSRINPPGITNDLLLNQHCQELINRSIDNWASKWYDRFQYWAQGIFY